MAPKSSTIFRANKFWSRLDEKGKWGKFHRPGFSVVRDPRTWDENEPVLFAVKDAGHAKT
jgi:hypothetical protein